MRTGCPPKAYEKANAQESRAPEGAARLRGKKIRADIASDNKAGRPDPEVNEENLRRCRRGSGGGCELAFRCNCPSKRPDCEVDTHRATEQDPGGTPAKAL